MVRRIGIWCAIVALSLVPAVAQGVPVAPVDPSTLTVEGIVTFDTVAGSAQPGVNYDGIVVVDGASFAERFEGQVLSFNGNFDVLGELPTTPLALRVGSAGQNVVILDNLGTNVLAGLGRLGFPDNDAGGEGSIAMLFALDQFEIGLSLIGGNGGSATVDFFDRTGTIIHTIELTGLTSETAVAFRREGNIVDIAGISIYTTDQAGIGVDDVRFRPPVATEMGYPASFLLLCVGLMGVTAMAWVSKRYPGSSV